MLRSIAASLTMLFLLAGAAAADAPPADSPKAASDSAAGDISPTRLALAKQVMALSGATKVYDDYDKNLDMMLRQMLQGVPNVDQSMVDDLRKIALEEFAVYKPQLMDGSAAIYARHFSEDDLRALIAFYKSDAGKHLSAELPAVSAECMQLSVPFTKDFMARVQEYLIEKAAAQKPDQSEDKKKTP